MIGIPSATPAGPGAGLPAALAAAAPAAGLPVVDLVFDDVFRQLTGGLLTTSASAGEAMAEVEFDEIATGENGGGDPGTDALPFAAVPAPVIVTQPIRTIPPPALSDGEGGDLVAAAPAESGPVPAVSGGGTTARSTAPGAPTAADVAPFDAATLETAPFENASGAADGDDTTVVAKDAEVLAALTPPANAAGTATPATEVEAHVRGLDRRRGMRETPARARTFDTAAVDTPVGTPAPVAAPAAGQVAPAMAGAPASSAAAPAETPTAVPREMPATAERAFALQRALARQSENPHRDGAAPGLAAQVVLTGAAASGGAAESGADAALPGKKQGRAWTGAVAPSAPHPAPGLAGQLAQAGVIASGGGAEPGSDTATHGKKQGRAWTVAMTPGAPVPGTAAPAAQAAVAAHVAPSASTSEPTGPGPVPSAAWRAAFASSALADLAGSAAAAARPLAAPGLVAGLPAAVELAAIRERGPLVVETPLAVADLDADIGEYVHTQIVKSIRMQWTGGLGEARVSLKPEYLGEVTATIKVEHGVVTATLQADTPEVRRWIESHTATLRDALVDHGLKLDRLTVGEPERQPAQGDRQSKPRQQPQQQAPRQRARREASHTDTPFEVTTD